MSKQVQLRRGTSAENDQFTGAEGEITVDTTNDSLRIHDGLKKGGYPLMKGNSPITGATYTKITYDSKGLVVSGEDLDAEDIPDLSGKYVPTGSKIEAGEATKVRFNKYGQITETMSLEDSDIPFLPISKVLQLQDELNKRALSLSINVPSSTSGAISLKEGCVNKVVLSGTCSFVLPSVTDASILRQLMVQLYKPVGSYTVTLGTEKYISGIAPVLTEVGYYNIYYEYDVNAQAWYCEAIYKGN